MPKETFERLYVMLHPVSGQASGFARVEVQRGRGRVVIRASHLPQKPVRAMLVSCNGEAGAVLDLGLLRSTGEHQAALNREHVPLPGGYHALALASDWPQTQVLLCGWLRSRPGCTLWQVQRAVDKYLAVPAADSAPAPPELPRTEAKRPVLMLRSGVPT